MINHLEQKRMNLFILTFYNDCMVSIRYKRSSQIKGVKPIAGYVVKNEYAFTIEK